MLNKIKQNALNAKMSKIFGFTYIILKYKYDTF